MTTFAQSIWAKVNLTRSSDLNHRERQRVREAIGEDIKKLTDLLPPSVSLAARLEAERRGVNLRQKVWHDQHGFDKGRATFAWEHVVTVDALREQCLAAASPAGVASVLQTARVAWILKEEDGRLSALGHRWKRPDPDRAYQEAGIILE